MARLNPVPLLLLALLATPAVLAPGASAQIPPDPSQVDPTLVGRLLDDLAPRAQGIVENETGEDITGEDVDLTLHVNVTDVEFDLVGAMFGGGKIASDFRVTGHFEYRVISLKRLQDAFGEINTTTNVSLQDTFGINASKAYLTAEEFRLLGGGALAEAFQEAEVRAARRVIERAIPGVTVLSADFEWSNLVPARELREEGRVSLKDPPVVLDLRFHLRFLDHVVLSDFLSDYFTAPPSGGGEEGAPPEKSLQERIKENQTAPFLEQSALMILGLDQLLATEVPPGWLLNLSFTVPRGFTIEGATDELVVSADKRTATYYADGSQVLQPLERASVVTLSSRTLVVTVIAVVVLLTGLLARVLSEGTARFFWRRRPTRVPVKVAPASAAPLDEPAEPTLPLGP